MSKVAQYLQEHVIGEVSESLDARRYLSTDNSIFSVAPSIIMYPRTEQDIRKTARFTWQLAERGRVLPITPRGAGAGYSGAALGSGIAMLFPAHLNRIVQLDAKTGDVVVEPGLNFGRLQQTLQTHDRFIPAYPAGLEYSTVGGAVAGNACGEKSIKYGSMLEHTKKLRVVLSNGEVITTGRLNKRELSRKLGLTTFEGEIYRLVDALIEENKDVIAKMSKNVERNTAGYNIADVRQPGGGFDLTPLFVGAEGTLGIISEITLQTEQFNPETTLIMANFSDVASCLAAVKELKDAPETPSVLDFVDGQLLGFVGRLNENNLKGVIDKPYPAMTLFIEYDNASIRQRRRSVKTARAILGKHAASFQEETDIDKQAKLWKIRQSSASLLTHSEKRLRAIPIIDDAVVPLDKFGDLIAGAYKLFADAKLQIALWGQAGEGLLHIHPFFDIGQLGDRQRAFKLFEEYYKLVIKLGGVTSGKHGDGRLRAPLLPKLYGEKGYDLLKKIKKIFDPHGTMNPGVKIDVTLNQNKQSLRSEYSLDHLYSHMPRS